MSDEIVMGDLSARCTARGKPPTNPDNASVPDSAKLSDGQYADHWVLCETERAKGYVRPVRESYQHIGAPGPKYPLRDLTPEEHARYDQYGYVKYEEYPADSGETCSGMFWTQDRLDNIGKGCGTVTRMPRACAETYARKPDYYGSTFCCGCGAYFPVGKHGEFVWDGSKERVGT